MHNLRRPIALLSAVLFATVVAAGCGGEDSRLLREQSRAAADGVAKRDVPKGGACTYGETDVSIKEVETLLKQAFDSYEANGQPVPKKKSKEYLEVQGQAINFLIDQELFDQAAKDRGVDVSKKDVEEKLEELKQQYFQGDEKQYEAELKKSGMSEAELQDQIRTGLLRDAVFEDVTKEVAVSDKDAEKYFEENIDQYGEPAKRTVAHILVAGKDGAAPTKKEKALADDLYEQVKNGDEKVFTALAKKHSADPGSKDKGGVLEIRRGETVPEFDEVAFELKTGDVSKPVKTQFGYHIITARTDVEESKKPEFSEFEEQVQQQVEADKKGKAYAKELQRLRSQAKLSVNCVEGYEWVPPKETQTEQEAIAQAQAAAQAKAAAAQADAQPAPQAGAEAVEVAPQ